MAPISEQRKAILSGLLAFATGLATALADNAITLGEGAIVLAGTVAAYVGVYGIRNGDGGSE